MTIPLFFPPPRFKRSLPVTGAVSLRALCALAGVPCRASGDWTERSIVLERSENCSIEAEPGGWGTVRIAVPKHLKPLAAHRYALAALAFSLMDLVARESIRGQAWSRPAVPRGRPPTGMAQSNRERQRAYRRRLTNGSPASGKR